MKKLSFCALFITAIQFAGFGQDTTRVWVTIDDPAIVHSVPMSRFDTLTEQDTIFSIQQAFPNSHTPSLRKVYELSCVCNNTTLVNKLSTTYGVSNPVAIFDPSTMYVPDDYSIAFTTDYALDLINAIGAWQYTTGDPNVLLGITDENFDLTHEELVGKIAFGGSTGLPSVYHGTAVAVTAAGATNNGLGKSSIGHDCRLILEIMNYNGMLVARDNGAKVINASWHDGGCTFNSYSQAIMDELYNDGVVVIAAAGNGNVTCGTSYGTAYPAGYNHVISVTSVGPNDNHERYPGDPASAHQHNASVDISAPGYDVPLTVSAGWYLTGNGTSFAAPFVTGTAGLMLSVNPCLTVDQVETILKSTSVDIDALNPTYAGLIGEGRLDAEAAVAMAVDYLPSVTLPTCFNGTATVNNGMLTGPVTYSWSNGQTTQTATGLVSGTTYTVTITNGAGCSVQQTVLPVNTSVGVNLTVTNSCTYDEGKIVAAPSSGVAPYTYLWDNGATTSTITTIAPGPYSVTVTDALGCTATASATITQVAQTGDFDYPNGLTITSTSQTITDLTGDGKIRIRGVLKFTGGVQYTMTGKTIQFARDLNFDIIDQGVTHSGIIVDIAAKMTATSCTFTSVDLCTAMWEGIQVWGGSHSQVNGKLVLTSSGVRDAHTGVACYRTHLPNILNPEYGKGVLEAKSSTFTNNRVSIALRAGVLIPNVSTITGCAFVNNALLKDQNRYPNEGAAYFISLTEVSGPTIIASTFTGNSSFATDKRATAIISHNSKYTVSSGYVNIVTIGTPPITNKFYNLTKGIDVYSTGGSTMSVKIKNNLFSNVQQAITSNGSNFDEISYNSFSIPAGTSTLNTWGMNLYSSSGFYTAENSFATSATSNYTYGLISRNNTLAGSKHYRNTFPGNFYAATQLEQTNTNLQLQCNTYTGNNTYDWAITSGTLGTQGACTNASTGANNYFPACSAADQSQIYKASAVPAFAYRSATSLNPTCKSPGVNTTNCTYIPVFANNCPEVTENPCPDCGGISMLNKLEDYGSAAPEDAAVLKSEIMQTFIYEDKAEELVKFLEAPGNAEPRILIPTYIELGKYEEALQAISTLENLSENEAADMAVYQLLARMYASNNFIRDLKETDLEQLRGLANQGSVPAQSVLAEFYQSDILRFAEPILKNDGETNLIASGSNESEFLEIYPNPSDGAVNLRYDFSEGQTIVFIDALGRTERKVLIGENTGLISLDNIQAGVFVVLVESDGTIIQQQRVVIMK